MATTKVLGAGCAVALALWLAATATAGTVNATALASTCAHGGQFSGPHWVWRVSDPDAVGFGCVFTSDSVTVPWSAQAARARAICTAAGWSYYDFGNGDTGLYGYYGWGCQPG